MKKTNRRINPDHADYVEIACPPIAGTTGGTYDLTSFRAFEFLAFRHTVITDATLINRFAFISLTGEGSASYAVGANNSMGASTTTNVTFMRGMGHAQIALPFYAYGASFPIILNPQLFTYLPLSAQAGDVVQDCVLACKVWR